MGMVDELTLLHSCKTRSLRYNSGGKPLRPTSSTSPPQRCWLSWDPVLFTHAKPRSSRINYHVLDIYLYAGSNDMISSSMGKPSGETH
jgi:hypothetical protein